MATVRTAPVLLVSCSYELRSTCNADVARRHNDELAGRQFISVLPQRLIQMFDFGLQLGPRKPEKQHASVGEALIENQLAEIPVGNNQNSLFLAGDRKDILVGKTMGVVRETAVTSWPRVRRWSIRRKSASTEPAKGPVMPTGHQNPLARALLTSPGSLPRDGRPRVG